MSRRAKRMYTAGVVGVLVAGMLGAGVVVWQAYLRPATAGEPGGEAGEPEAINPVVYGRVRELLGRLRLSDSALAGIGVDGAGAEGVFGAAVGWVEANLDTWSVRRSAVRAARRRVHAATGKLRGTAADGEILRALPKLKAALATAKAAEAQLVAGAIPVIAAKLTDGQKTAWAAIRAAPKDAGGYAMAPGITAGQLQKLRMAKWKKARQQLIAKTASDRSAAAASYGRSIDTALTGGQKLALATAGANVQRNLSAVIAARQKVLPRPAELIADAEAAMLPPEDPCPDDRYSARSP